MTSCWWMSLTSRCWQCFSVCFASLCGICWVSLRPCGASLDNVYYHLPVYKQNWIGLVHLLPASLSPSSGLSLCQRLTRGGSWLPTYFAKQNWSCQSCSCASHCLTSRWEDTAASPWPAFSTTILEASTTGWYFHPAPLPPQGLFDRGQWGSS